MLAAVAELRRHPPLIGSILASTSMKLTNTPLIPNAFLMQVPLLQQTKSLSRIVFEKSLLWSNKISNSLHHFLSVLPNQNEAEHV